MGKNTRGKGLGGTGWRKEGDRLFPDKYRVPGYGPDGKPRGNGYDDKSPDELARDQEVREILNTAFDALRAKGYCFMVYATVKPTQFGGGEGNRIVRFATDESHESNIPELVNFMAEGPANMVAQLPIIIEGLSQPIR